MRVLIKAFKTKIYPTKTQKQYFQKCFGIRRFAWNWAVENWDTYKSWTKLDKAWNHNEEFKEERPYLYEVSSMIKTQAFKSISETWKMFFKNPSKYGKPNFKSKKKDSNRFSMFEKCASTQKTKTIMFSSKWINLNATKKIGRLKFKAAEDLEFLNECRVAEWTISETNGDYYISIIYERANQIEHIHPKEKIGLDGGVKTIATGFDGSDFSEIKMPKSIFSIEKQIDYLNKKLAKKEYNSYRWRLLRKRMSKLYIKASNIKRDLYNKTVHSIATTYKNVNYEGFTFKTTNNSRINRSLSRTASYLFKELLENKCKEFGTTLNIIENEPTTQTCSCCGNRFVGKEKLTLLDREYKCLNCGLEIGRDENSAINIYNLV